MGGFGSIVGFIFAFFVIIGLFVAAFGMYNSQIIDQAKILETNTRDVGLGFINHDYTLERFLFVSGRMQFDLDNFGSEEFFFKDNNYAVCSDVYLNGSFYDSSKVYFGIPKKFNSQYRFFEGNSNGFFITQGQVSGVSNFTAKVISCGGRDKVFVFDSTRDGWWNSSWSKRKRVNVNYTGGGELSEYQVMLKLNNSYLDFDSFKPDDLRVVSSISEFLVLDLPFDDYQQSLREFSNYSLSAFLGSGAGVEAIDPVKESDSPFFGGLNFDGVNDYVRVADNRVLDNTSKLTISGWFKPQNLNGLDQGLVSKRLAIDNAQAYSVFLGAGNRLYVDLNGSSNRFGSNTVFSNNIWYHFAVVFDGEKNDSSRVKLYVNGVLDNSSNDSSVSIPDYASDLYLGVLNPGTGVFRGSLDEVRVFDLVLSDSEVKDLYSNFFGFRSLDFYVATFEPGFKEAVVFVKVPYLSTNRNFDFDLYYGYAGAVPSISNIESTFSYEVPRRIGFVVSDRPQTTGLELVSGYNNNSIFVGNDFFSLNKREISALAGGSVSMADEIKAKYLASVVGNGNGDDMVVPISWAGTEFVFRNFPTAGLGDRFCMMSPFGTTWFSIYDAAVLEYNASIAPMSVSCVNMDITTANRMRINSTLPILVSYYGTDLQNAFVLYPARERILYGVPSANLYVANGQTANNYVSIYRSSGAVNTVTLGAAGTTNLGGLGNDGTAPAFKVFATYPVGSTQYQDSDGTETTVFVPAIEMGTKFFSSEPTENVVIVSAYGNANCSTYNNVGTLVGNMANGVGTNGVYKYGFSLNDVSYLAGGWSLECSKPVWVYYDEDVDGDETNLFGHLQMRQYVYPEPVIVFK